MATPTGSTGKLFDRNSTLPITSINRGMSLEAIAALLGHKSMSMTLTYAKIADRTVANEYFNVTNRIEALYAPAPLPADAEGPNCPRTTSCVGARTT